MTFAIPYPVIDPVLIEIGPLVIRWYALAYVFGLVFAWRYVRAMARRAPYVASARDIDDFLVWATLGVVLGGRIGFVLFYNLDYYLTDPLAALQVWRGGMSFHGGLVGVVIAAAVFCWKRRIRAWAFGDMLFCAAPIGLFLGRIANFINGELVGRVTDVPWGMVFPGWGPDPRHPSQLYEAALEGVALLVILRLMWRVEAIRRRPGVLSGAFLIGYAVFRSFAEVFRQFDPTVGLLIGGTTQGQWLSLPMLIAGVVLIAVAKRRGGRRPATA